MLRRSKRLKVLSETEAGRRSDRTSTRVVTPPKDSSHTHQIPSNYASTLDSVDNMSVTSRIESIIQRIHEFLTETRASRTVLRLQLCAARQEKLAERCTISPNDDDDDDEESISEEQAQYEEDLQVANNEIAIFSAMKRALVNDRFKGNDLTERARQCNLAEYMLRSNRDNWEHTRVDDLLGLAFALLAREADVVYPICDEFQDSAEKADEALSESDFQDLIDSINVSAENICNEIETQLDELQAKSTNSLEDRFRQSGTLDDASTDKQQTEKMRKDIAEKRETIDMIRFWSTVISERGCEACSNLRRRQILIALEAFKKTVHQQENLTDLLVGLANYLWVAIKFPKSKSPTSSRVMFDIFFSDSPALL